MFCVSVTMSCSWYLPQIGSCSQWPAHVQFAWSFKEHQTCSMVSCLHLEGKEIGDQRVLKAGIWTPVYIQNGPLFHLIVCSSPMWHTVSGPCYCCVFEQGHSLCLNETLRSCRLAKNFGIKLGDCSTEHLAQVVVFILRFLKTCWEAFIVDLKIWHGHFPKSWGEWGLYANCEVSAWKPLHTCIYHGLKLISGFSFHRCYSSRPSVFSFLGICICSNKKNNYVWPNQWSEYNPSESLHALIYAVPSALTSRRPDPCDNCTVTQSVLLSFWINQRRRVWIQAPDFLFCHWCSSFLSGPSCRTKNWISNI